MQLLLNTILLEANRWAKDKTPARPLTALLPAVAEAGFDRLELWQYHVSSLDDGGVDHLRQTLAARSIQTPALGAYPLLHREGADGRADAEALDALVGRAALLGATTFKIFPGRLGSATTTPDQYRRSVGRLKDLDDALAARNMRLTLETHGNTLCDTLDGTARLLDDLDGCSNVGLCFQPYTDQDTDQALAAFDRFADRILHIHLQNRDAEGACTLLEKGVWIDYARLLPHVRAADFDDLLCIEFTAGITPPPGQTMDVQAVIDNAVADRDFTLRQWNA